MSNFLTDRWDTITASLDRRIDNEINGEFMPSPTGQGESGEVTIKTSEDQFGRAKSAGTGGRLISAIPDAVVYVGLALVAGVIAFKVIK